MYNSVTSWAWWCTAFNLSSSESAPEFKASLVYPRQPGLYRVNLSQKAKKITNTVKVGSWTFLGRKKSYPLIKIRSCTIKSTKQ